MLEGLAFAHARGIVHRDVKPSNVLLAEEEHVSVRLFDFGLALMADADTLTAVGDVPGTLAYISPERLHGQEAGPAADVWAVGVLLWEALAGHHPFWRTSPLETGEEIKTGAPSIREARPDLPDGLIAAVDAALSVEPGAQAGRFDARRRPPRGVAGTVQAPGSRTSAGATSTGGSWPSGSRRLRWPAWPWAGSRRRFRSIPRSGRVCSPCSPAR